MKFSEDSEGLGLVSDPLGAKRTWTSSIKLNTARLKDILRKKIPQKLRMKNFEEKYFCWKWLVSNPDILSFTLRFDKRGQFKRPKFWADLANVAKNYEGLKLFIKMSLSAPEKLLDIMWHFLFPKVRIKNKISEKKCFFLKI